MDKYTYNIKADKIQKLVKKGDFEAAVKIADTVDWEEVHSVRLLTITAAAYENMRDYKSAIELLQMAYEESAVGKRILYKLTGLAIAEGDVELAQHYYEMYLQEASDDNGRYLLRYLLAELKKEPLDKRIAILETYRKYEFEEEWALRLAQMYDEAGMADECVKLCDEIVLWFGVGDYVDEALALKEKYAPLSAEQRDHRDNKEFYEQRYQEVVEEYTDREAALSKAEMGEEAEAENVPEVQEEAWPEQIMLVEADNLEDAVPKTLEKMAAYYRGKGLPMGKLTRISAERFNQVGFEAAREHTKGKDLLVDDASALSEDLLSDIVHSVKYEQNSQLFILADKPTQLAYLDARLGEFVANPNVVPQIKVSELGAENVLIHMTETVENELSEQKEKVEEQLAEAGESVQNSLAEAVQQMTEEQAEPVQAEEPKEEKTAEPDVSAAEKLAGDEAEQLEFNFDSFAVPAEQDWAAAAGATLTGELPKLDALQKEAEAKPAEAEVKAPEVEAAIPEVEVKAPEIAAELPEVEVKAPEIVAELPEVEVKAPENAAELPEVEVKAPEIAAELPEVEVKASDAAADIPEVEIKLPEIAEELPKMEMNLPEAEAEIPDVEIRLPSMAAAIPEAEISLPEVAAAIPEAEAKLPEAVSEIPETEKKLSEAVAEVFEKEKAEAAEKADTSVKDIREAVQASLAGLEATAEPEKEDEEESGSFWSFTDFLGDQKAALQATEKVKEEAEEAWQPFVGKFDSIVEDVKETAKEIQKPAASSTKEIPVSEVKNALSAAEKADKEKLTAGATMVVKDVKKLAAEAEKEAKSLEGETKVVPKISNVTGAIGAIGMSEAAFVEYAKNYLHSIDCVLDDVGDLALQNAAESRREQGILLTKEEAENMIEDAADMAERKGGLFVKRYDKDGCLILRSKYIK